MKSLINVVLLLCVLLLAYLCYASVMDSDRSDEAREQWEPSGGGEAQTADDGIVIQTDTDAND